MLIFAAAKLQIWQDGGGFENLNALILLFFKQNFFF